MNYVSEQKKKVIRMTSLNSEQVALSEQPRISEFLSDNANKDSIRPTAPSSPDVEKTSNLSTQVENVPLLKESVSEAEGTAKVAWSVVKPSTTSTSLVEPQNPSNSSDIACTSKVKRGKNYEKKTKEKRSEWWGVWLVCHWPTLIRSLLITPPFKPKGLENLRILYPLKQTSHRNVDNMKSLMICKEAKQENDG